MRMAPTLDTGDILLQESTVILPEENEEALHDRLAGIGASTLVNALEMLEQKKANFIKQDEKLATYARKITKEDGHIVWNEAARAIHDRVRALSRWPGTFTFYKDKRILIRKASVTTHTQPGSVPGQVIAASEKEGILIATKTGALKAEELQLEGRKALPAALFLQGFALRVGDILE